MAVLIDPYAPHGPASDIAPSLTLGLYSFPASPRHAHEVAKNGLPLVSAAIEVYSRFQALKTLTHSHLCRYLDIHRDDQCRLITVAEHSKQSLTDLSYPKDPLGDERHVQLVLDIAHQTLSALRYLHDHNMLVYTLQPADIRLVHRSGGRSGIQLANYGLFYMTDRGFFVDFPLGNPYYQAPDALLAQALCGFDGPDSHLDCLPAVDSWSVGVILCEVLTGTSFWNEGVTPGSLFATLENLYHDTLTHSGVDAVGTWHYIREHYLFSNLNPDCAFRLLDRYDALTAATADPTELTDYDHRMRDLLATVFRCLAPNELHRPAAAQLLGDRAFADYPPPDPPADAFVYQPQLRCLSLSTTDPPPAPTPLLDLARLDPTDLYHLWTVAGGRATEVYDQHFALPTRAPVEQLPVTLGAPLPELLGEEDDGEATDPYPYLRGTAPLLFTTMTALIRDQPDLELDLNADHFDETTPNTIDFTVETAEDAEDLCTSALLVRFTTAAHRNVLEADRLTNRTLPLQARDHRSTNLSDRVTNDTTAVPPTPMPHPGHTAALPVGTVPALINVFADMTPDRLRDYQRLRVSQRERDVRYQHYRTVLFRRLLDHYPASRVEIIREARVDVPPHLRAEIWAAVLGVLRCDEWVYRRIDKEAPGPTDKQIDVDIPRCHQYHSLLGSTAGHTKLRRLLKAWLRAHPHLVYWQGFDSVSAPFLTLHFNHEYRAFACLTRFVQKYVPLLYTTHNADVMGGYFAVFQHLLTFHDPELALHLLAADFTPQLYAVSWFLTMFTHVFSLDKTYLIWDRFLVSPREFPYFFGLAILRQARQMLLGAGFNEHVTLFTNTLPAMDVEQCLASTQRLWRATPPSLTRLPPEADGVAASDDDQGGGTDAETKAEPKTPESGPWWTVPVSLTQRQAELVPRLFVEDLRRLGDLALVVDLRDERAYSSDHVRGSVRIPEALQSTVPGYLRALGRQYLVVVANDIMTPPGMQEEEETAPQQTEDFIKLLVQASFVHVCRLHGGIRAVRDALYEAEAASVTASEAEKLVDHPDGAIDRGTTDGLNDSDPFLLVNAESKSGRPGHPNGPGNSTEASPSLVLCRCRAVRTTLTASRGRTESRFQVMCCSHGSGPGMSPTPDASSLRPSTSNGTLSSLSNYLRNSSGPGSPAASGIE